MQGRPRAWQVAARLPQAPGKPSIAEPVAAMTALARYGLRGLAKLAAMAHRLHAACVTMLAAPNGDESLKAPVAPPARRSPPAPGAVKASEVYRRTRQARAASATAE